MEEHDSDALVNMSDHDGHEHGNAAETALMAIGGALLSGVIALRLADGSASALVQSWYLPVLAVTCLFLFALAGHAFWRVRTERQSWVPAMSPQRYLAIGVAAVPIGIALIYQPSPLGSANLDSTAGGDTRFSESARSGSGERNVYQWAYHFETAPSGELDGQDFEAVGFVYHRPESAAGQFELARFVVACCVADAVGFTLPIQWQRAQELSGDSWVRVEGKVGTGPDGRPIVLAKVVETIAAPSNPYVYP